MVKLIIKVYNDHSEVIVQTESYTQRILINSSGYVGIGSTIPASTFDVLGTIRTTGVTTPSAGVGLEFAYNNGGQITSYNRSASSYQSLLFNASSHSFAKDKRNY